jgi:hypothetical protein
MLLISLAVAGFAIMLDKLSPPDPDKVRRILANATPVPIDRAPDGAAAIVRGRVGIIDAELTAPLSGRACVCWLVVFDEVGAKDFVELGRAHDSVSFVLRSEAGTARVVPDDAMLGVTPIVYSQQMPAALHYPSGMGHADPVIALAQRACTKAPNHHTTMLRASEYAVVPGELATVRGWVAHEVDPDGAR